MVLEQVKATVNRPVWEGGHTLHVGEVLAFIVAIALIYFAPLGKWSVWVALVVCLVAMIIW